MVKVTIETDGQETVVMEGKGIAGSFVVQENEDSSVDVDDVLIGVFDLNTLTAALHNTVVAYMATLKSHGMTESEVSQMIEVALNHSKEIYLAEVK
ncbi:hypothetical protein SECTIM467_163 [Brevibacillus phage SecTim467]|uniref:Uncharacterized protein n=2 Tax=Jenstvirus jenst TaxID=1982225 RepID=A0A0K2CNY1_9CAUD|nr:hypothetical protein AVV11_gp033 [Brevibacillus phage Jenst]ALA07287.1 hypothetical protein JENST_158 [Brevibacillus phage Jenst]ALA07486.1 hypothetical protein SECTIM467_163 [Brevibacillus phage SecTim467]